MNTEPFWQLIPNKGCELWIKSKSPMRSFSNLTTAVKCAIIDYELKELFLKKEESKILLHFLLDTYFPETDNNFLFGSGKSYISEIENQILKESEVVYKKRLLEIRKELDNDGFQEEIFVRKSVFKKQIPKIYNYTCCISELRIDAGDNISIIDACHIIPFSESFNDTISNGIALCPNLHRAFDRGLISIDKSYKVLINKRFSEPFQTNYSIKQFKDKRIFLPDEQSYYPSVDSFIHHQKKFGFFSF